MKKMYSMRHGIVDVTEKFDGHSLVYTISGPHDVYFNSDGKWYFSDKYETLISLDTAEKLGLITRKMRKIAYFNKDSNCYEIDTVPCDSKEEFDMYFEGFDYTFLGFVVEKLDTAIEYEGLV